MMKEHAKQKHRKIDRDFYATLQQVGETMPQVAYQIVAIAKVS
jgi:hypothetical protein